MSREQYTPPSLGAGGSSSQQQGGSGAGSGAFNLTGAGGAGGGFDDGASLRPVRYLCGDCDSEVVLKKGDAIRCKECGYRVLYKQRTNR